MPDIFALPRGRVPQIEALVRRVEEILETKAQKARVEAVAEAVETKAPMSEVKAVEAQVEALKPRPIKGNTPANGIVVVPFDPPVADALIFPEIDRSPSGRPVFVTVHRVHNPAGKLTSAEVFFHEIVEAPVKSTVAIGGLAISTGTTIGKADPVRPAAGVPYRIDVVLRSA